MHFSKPIYREKGVNQIRNFLIRYLNENLDTYNVILGGTAVGLGIANILLTLNKLNII